MAQVRVEKKDKYTQIDNSLIRNRELSLKAKGLLIYMLSLPEDWDYSIAGLSMSCKEGKSSIRSAIDELIEQRYITRSLGRAENGTFDGYEYVVYEEPQPSCENPTTDDPTSENRTQQIKDITNKDKTNPPIVPPEGDAPAGEAEPVDKPAETPAPKAKRRRKSKYVPSHDPEKFEIIWAEYPRKDSRDSAVKEWDQIMPDRELCRVMYKAIKRQCKSEQWTKDNGQYIPMFSTWLHNGRWKDQGVDQSLLKPPSSRAPGGWADDPEVCT